LVDIGCSSIRAPLSVSYYNEISGGHIGSCRCSEEGLCRPVRPCDALRRNRQPSIKIKRATVKRNLNDKLKVSNAEIIAFSYARKLHHSRSGLLINKFNAREAVMCPNARLPNMVK